MILHFENDLEYKYNFVSHDLHVKIQSMENSISK